MSKEFKALLRKAKDEVIKIESRAEMSIDILNKIAFKHKPSNDDIKEIQRVIRILKGL